MNNNFTNNQNELMRRLSIATHSSKRMRALRLMTHPWRMLYPKLMKIMRRTENVNARTFWGGEMSVILPEQVSTNIWRYGCFEENVCLYLLSVLKDGMTFIDVGAHFGFFSLLASYLVGQRGKVLAFEPIPNTFHQLQNNISNYSRYPNVEIFNCAAYSEDTEIKFYDYGLEDSAYNSAFGLREKGNPSIPPKEIVVKARKLDTVLKVHGIEEMDLV